jgi:hypothetical protein
MHQATRGGLAPQIWVGFFFKGPLKKIQNCCENKVADQKKKRSLIKNYKGPLPLPKQKISTN